MSQKKIKLFKSQHHHQHYKILHVFFFFLLISPRQLQNKVTFAVSALEVLGLYTLLYIYHSLFAHVLLLFSYILRISNECKHVITELPISTSKSLNAKSPAMIPHDSLGGD